MYVSATTYIENLQTLFARQVKTIDQTAHKETNPIKTP